ncbi:threonine synthase [Luminiphilus syltensis]|uniref:threonine synthase n=1 Tax=Luminiphilus syltensis TaxID=1341119 RepID=UPI0005907AC8|nr:threonine synthase [Luminiphilus syltensis]
MRYVSTRGAAPSLDFEQVLLTGLAADGGLYVPDQLPEFSLEQIRSWRELDYPSLALEILQPFVEGSIPREDLKTILADTYRDFRHSAVAPLQQLDTNQWVLELFHGPTLAFKDFALQLLGRLLDYMLERRQQKIVIMGATSGDTGSAAIEGCRRCKNIDIFILHPHDAVSDVQRRQMTTVAGDNIHNIALQGNFDDCQAMVKSSFVAPDFLPDGRSLVAVNSINWARIMAQIVYYFYSALALGGPDRPVNFSVPTGNFGDIFAGYLARQMGLPIDRLVIATNRNDVLHQVLETGTYRRLPLEKSLSPSMDITVSSNFERLMFDMYHRDGSVIAQLMDTFASGEIELDASAMAEARGLFASHRVSDALTCQTIARVWSDCGYLLDPHSAIGVAAAGACALGDGNPMVTLATAHPAKFPDAISAAGVLSSPELPAHLADLFEREERYTVLENQLSTVQTFMAEHCSA